MYEYATTEGLLNDAGQVVFAPSRVASILSVDGATQATRLEEVEIGTFTDGALVDAAQAALDDAAANLEANPAAAGLEIISVSGDSITTRNGLDAFTKSMLISLPLALVLTFLIAAAFLRSVKYAVVSVVPILLVVAWVYGFMFVADYSINPVTSTIAAIAIGVGIDFATHFTVRFREELAGEASRFPALRRAGEGTGGALVISALTSIAGFTVLGLAPMPIFAVYGVLTAVMIALAVLVTLLVLPSLLLFVTPSLKGEERDALELELTPGTVGLPAPPKGDRAAGLTRRLRDRLTLRADMLSRGGESGQAAVVAVATGVRVAARPPGPHLVSDRVAGEHPVPAGGRLGARSVRPPRCHYPPPGPRLARKAASLKTAPACGRRQEE